MIPPTSIDDKNVMTSSPSSELMEISAYCVEQIGKILTQTDTPIADETAHSITYEDKSSTTALLTASLSIPRTPTLVPRFGVLTHTDQVYPHIVEEPKSKIQVHICECISVIMCCNLLRKY
jgi:hypothetical protein